MIPPLNIQIKPYHVWFREITCRCWNRKDGPFCCGGMVDTKLLDQFERIRDSVSFYTFKKTPIHISSGYRCLEWNRLQGSKDTSYHVKGAALDLHTPPGITLAQFTDIVFSQHMDIGGILVYPWGLHIDLGPTRFLDMRK